MTSAAEKAKELVDKFMVLGAAIFVAKQCALICVDEILESFERDLNRPMDGVSQTMTTPIGISEITEPYKHFWQSVKQAINEL